MKTNKKKRKGSSLEVYRQSKKKVMDEKCTICQYEIPSKKNMMFLPCCHFYHSECIVPWLNINITCPECRIPIFIDSFEQLETFNSYKEKQYNNQDLIRDNVQVNENTVSRMFMQEPTLFSLNNVDDVNYEKFYQIMQSPPYSLIERYRDLIEEYGELSDGEINIFNVDIDVDVNAPGPSNERNLSVRRRPTNRPLFTRELLREISIRRQSRLHALQWNVNNDIDNNDIDNNEIVNMETINTEVSSDSDSSQNNRRRQLSIESTNDNTDESTTGRNNVQTDENISESNNSSRGIVIISRTSSNSSISGIVDVSLHATHIYFDSDEDDVHINSNLTSNEISHINEQYISDTESTSSIQNSLLFNSQPINQRPATPLPEIPIERTNNQRSLTRSNAIVRQRRIPRIIINSTTNTVVTRLGPREELNEESD